MRKIILYDDVNGKEFNMKKAINELRTLIKASNGNDKEHTLLLEKDKTENLITAPIAKAKIPLWVAGLYGVDLR